MVPKLSQEKLQESNIGFICTEYQVKRGLGSKVAVRFLDAELQAIELTYKDLDARSNQVANLLHSEGFAIGDKAFIFLPKCIEVYEIFLGILKAGLIAGTLFSSFGPEALLDRLLDSRASVVFTKKKMAAKLMRVIDQLPNLKEIILIDGDDSIELRQKSYHQLMSKMPIKYSCEITGQKPAILHYTSGSTGKPKGVLHVHNAIQSHLSSFEEVFQPLDDDIYWCTADPAWVTGTSYGIIAPLARGITQVQYAGVFDPSTWLSIIEREHVRLFYTAPTVLRMMMQFEDETYIGFDLSRLRHIYSVGEPLNPEIYKWGIRVLKHEIYDTWFQTETGAIQIANRPPLKIKPGSMGMPLSSVRAKIVDENCNNLPPESVGKLVLKAGWPSMFVDYLNRPEDYDSKFKCGYYHSGDLAAIDEDGYIWFKGRDDDVINTSGHLVSPFEVESCLLEMDEIVDVGVIGAPDSLVWEKVVAFVKLKPSTILTSALTLKIKLYVSNHVSPLATPAQIIPIEKIPKNQSGKVMRRVLRSIYTGTDPGDVSTMEEE
jgi:acetyl-CoA synthetase